MKAIKESFLEVAEKNGWSVFDQGPYLRMDMRGENGLWPGFAVCEEDERLFLFYTVLPSSAPAERMVRTAEMITRINYRMKTGAFELDYDTGEISFRVSTHILPEQEKAENYLGYLVWLSVVTMDKYYPAIMKVFYSDQCPKEIMDQLVEEVLIK